MTCVVAATILGSSSPSSAAVEYVKVCSLYGAGYYYIPGTDQCGNANPVGFRVQTESGVLTNQFTSTSTRYGVSGYAGGAGSSSFGYDAYAGGDPNAPVPMTPPPDPSDPSYDPDYAALYATNGGFWPRTGPNGWPSSRFPYSSFNNLNATAVGSGARAGAGAFGQDNATAVGQGASANGLNATTVGQGASANVTGGTAIGQGSSVTAAGAVAIGQGSVADVANTVSVGSVGHERRIMNVAAGVMGTDAVNLDQMNAAISAATGNTASGTDVSSAGGATASGDDAFAGGNGAVASGGSSTAIGSGAQATQMGGTAIGAGATASGDPTTAVGFNSNAAGTGANAFGAFATATGNNSTALGANSSASAANSVALGNGSVASRGAQTGYAAYGLSAPQTSAGEVSVGTPGAERQITHVAAGSAATDAVNVAQLQGATSELNGRINDANAGVAAALASAGLVQAVTPGSNVVTGGVGAWNGETAAAFGLSRRFDQHWTLKTAATVSGRAGLGANAAIGYEF
jgi:hypothetical protein